MINPFNDPFSRTLASLRAIYFPEALKKESSKLKAHSATNTLPYNGVSAACIYIAIFAIVRSYVTATLSFLKWSANFNILFKVSATTDVEVST